jgi:hypothetical protein
MCMAMNAAKNNTQTQFCENHSMFYLCTGDGLLYNRSAHRLHMPLLFFSQMLLSVRWQTLAEIFLLHFHNQPPSNPARFNPLLM